MYIGPHVKYLLFLCDWNEALIFLIDVLKNTQILNLMEICSVGDELFHVNRQTYNRTDMTKLIIAFHNFANMP
jgi:hypothetical protein